MTKYLITGGAGFVGSHLAETLLELGHEVSIIDDLSTGKFENIEHLLDNPRFSFAIDSIMNLPILDRWASGCDVIFHLAAAVGVKMIVENPVHTIETNLGGTEAVLNTSLRYRAKVMIASTSEVYGKSEQVPFKEDNDVLLGPSINNRWAYATSKLMDEFLALAYFKEKGLPVVIFRLFNTIGPRQRGRYGMVVPRFVQQALRGEPITIFGTGNQRRSFTWVGDAVDAMIKLSAPPKAIGEVFNIGHTKDISIYELAELVKQRTGSDSKLQLIAYKDAYAGGFEDMQRRLPDITKANREIGYSPTLDLGQMLDRIIEFQKIHLHKSD